MKTTITTWELKAKGGKHSRHTKGEIYNIAASTPEQALARISGGADQWTATGKTEVISYLHAPLIAAIVAAMGPTWDGDAVSDDDPKCNRWTLTRKDGLELFFALPDWSHKKAYYVSLSRPRHGGKYIELRGANYSDKISDPSAHIGETKTPEQVAKDILRRVVPESEKVHALALAEIARQQSTENNQIAALHEVCAAFGVPVEYEYHDTTRPRFEGQAGEVRFEVSYSGGVSLTLRSVDLETVRKVAAALKGVEA